MNQTLQLTDYIPQYVSLYYVDYRDDLDEHEDIQRNASVPTKWKNSMKRHTIFLVYLLHWYQLYLLY